MVHLLCGCVYIVLSIYGYFNKLQPSISPPDTCGSFWWVLTVTSQDHKVAEASLLNSIFYCFAFHWVLDHLPLISPFLLRISFLCPAWHSRSLVVPLWARFSLRWFRRMNLIPSGLIIGARPLPYTLFNILNSPGWPYRCGFGTPTLVQSGKILSTGEDYTSQGAFSSAIAWVLNPGLTYSIIWPPLYPVICRQVWSTEKLPRTF